MAGYETVPSPGGMSYAAPQVDFFGMLSSLPGAYRAGQQNRQQQDIATAFKGGLPIDPATGQPDYGKIMQVLAQKGDINAIGQLAGPQLAATEYRDAGQLSPLLSPNSSPAAPPAVPPSSPAAPQSNTPTSVASLPAPPSTGLNAGDQPGSVVDIVTAKLPQDSPTTGAVINNIARAAGVDPNAALTPAQSARVAQLTDAYVKRRPPAAAPAAPVAAPGATPNDRVAQAFAAPGPANNAAPPPPASAALAARTAPIQPTPVRTVAGTQAPQQPQPAPPAAAPRPLVPQVPLPPGYQPGQEQQAILALQTEAARLSRNPRAAGQVRILEDWAARIAGSLQPVKLGQADTIIDPRTQQVLAQGPAAAAFARNSSSTPTLDADAARYRETGTLPPNMGRGIQGQQEAQAIRTRAVEQELALGGDPNTWASRWQEFRATGVGLNTGARTRASREENLNLILKMTDAAVPAALEMSEKVARTRWVPINQLVQKGEAISSDPDLLKFGMANLQLAEGWARAMNPTGVMRESDRDKALSFLSTATSADTYRQLVTQLQTQIRRERDSIRGGQNATPQPGAAQDARGETPQPGAGAQGWVTLPNGVRYREKPAQQ